MQEGDPALAEEAISGWNAGQVKCRARQRHSWNPFTVVHHVSRSGDYYDVIEQCGYCKSRRHRVLSMAGYWQGRWKFIRYSEGYLMPKGSGGLTEEHRAGLRLTDVVGRKIQYVNDDDE